MITAAITCLPLPVGNDAVIISYSIDAGEFGDYAFETIATFSCLEGLSIVGPATSTCLEDGNGAGMFEPSSATCEREFNIKS